VKYLQMFLAEYQGGDRPGFVGFVGPSNPICPEIRGGREIHNKYIHSINYSNLLTVGAPLDTQASEARPAYKTYETPESGPRVRPFVPGRPYETYETRPATLPSPRSRPVLVGGLVAGLIEVRPDVFESPDNVVVWDQFPPPSPSPRTTS
jgi:hypothetical protein